MMKKIYKILYESNWVQKSNFRIKFLKYLSDNRTPVLILSICTIFAGTNLLNLFSQLFDLDFYLPWNKSWELWAAIATVIYSIYIHRQLKLKKHLKILDGEAGSKIRGKNLPLILLCLAIFISSFGGFNEWLNNFLASRYTTFSILIIAAAVYCNLNWTLHSEFNNILPEIKKKFAHADPDEEEVEYARSFYEKMSSDFYSSVFTSEIPNIITFLLLFLFYGTFKYLINNGSFNIETMNPIFLEILEPLLNNHQDQCSQLVLKQLSITALEYFASGAIAFQMMFSNAVWVFNDDKIIEQSPVIIDNSNN